MTVRLQRSRGCHIRNHPSGASVAMYVDEPGVYLFENGEPASVKMAEEAGFPVERHEQERQLKLKRDKMEKAIANGSNASQLDLDSLKIVPAETKGKYSIADANGNKATKTEMTLAQAKTTYMALTGAEWEDGAADKASGSDDLVG